MTGRFEKYHDKNLHMNRPEAYIWLKGDIFLLRLFASVGHFTIMSNDAKRERIKLLCVEFQ